MPESILNQSPPQPAAISMRQFGDVDKTRELIFQNALSSAQSIKPVTNARYSLGLQNVAYDKPEEFSIADQKRALLERGTLTRPLHGTWVLSDPTGNKLAEHRTILARVPYMTPRGNFVLNGTSYTLAHQMRLLPGIYTRQQDNGEIEAHANVRAGKGVSHHYSMDPKTGVFKLHVLQASMPLLPIARAVGLKDSELRQHWGDELFERNDKASDHRAVDKLLAKLHRGKDIPQAERESILTSLFSKMEFDPEVNARTLGHPFRTMDKNTLVAVTKKLLAVNRGSADTDDRDHLANQTVLGPEDLIAERFSRSGSVLNKLLWKATNRGSLDHIPSNALGKHVMSSLLDSGLGQPGEEINPAEILDHQFRISRLGVGGISDVSAVPAESRNVHPSQLGYIDLLKSPESFRAGVDMRSAYAVKKGADGRIYAEFRDARTGQPRWVSPQDLANKVITFPGELESGESHVSAIVGSRTKSVPRDRVDFVAPAAEKWFSPLTNLTPFKPADKAQRVSMGSRFASQALPLDEAETPLAAIVMPGENKSFFEKYGRALGAVHAEERPGRVLSVEPEKMVVRYDDGSVKAHELYNHFPYNQKTLLHNTPMVKPGDVVQPGQLLAKSNYTDSQGRAALGKNFRTAYSSFGGLNYEDAWVISESAAKRLSSQNLYQHELQKEDAVKIGKKHYVSIFGPKFNRQQLSTLDDAGVIKPGTIVKSGDPLIVAASERPATHKSVFSGHKGSWSDQAITWDHEVDGEVTDVSHTKDGITVAVKAVKAATVGDKLAGAHGDKGVIARVIPDDQMPRDPQTKLPYEILANPLGVISRTNAGQAVEGWLGKIAAKTGKPELAEDFNHERDLVDWAEKKMQEHGVSGYEEIEDPSNGRKMRVNTGMRYFMKLHHTAAGKHQGRGLGAYTADDEPAKGGPEGAKKTAMMNVNAYLSHNALGPLRDAGLIRGQKNHEYWSARMAGHTPATPPVTKTYRKFIDYLRAGGVNVKRTGSQLHLLAMTDQDVNDHAADRELKNAETVDWKDGYRPIPGGLFDEALFGSHENSRWAAIKLHEPLPNPVMEDPIKHLLGLTGKEFEATIAGQHKIGGKTGPEALATALASINVEKEIENCRRDIAGTRKGARDLAIRKLAYLKACEKTGVHPKDWILSRVPVLPTKFRAVSKLPGGSQLVADPNYLYKELFDANKSLAELSGQVDDVSEERLGVYRAFKGVVGLGDPTRPKNIERRVRGLLAHVFGDGPKYSMVQQKLLGKTTDLVGRAVIVPNPDLSMDEIGIPEKRAWEVYAPAIVRRLVQNGMKRTSALMAVHDRTQTAAKAMLAEMDARPVIANRAPVLHRFGQLAFFPRLVKGDTLQVSPLIVGGFGADFDGNCVDFNTEVVFHLQPNTIKKAPAEFRTKLEAVIVRLTGKTLVSWFAENREITMKIGDFPRMGEPQITSTGQAVYDVPPGISVLSYAPGQGVMLKPVRRFTVDKAHACVTVRTTRGREQILSDNESLCVYEVKTGELVKVRPQDHAGRLIPYVKNDPIFGTEFNRDIGWWYSVLVTCGSNQGHELVYNTTDAAQQDEFVAIAQLQFGDIFAVDKTARRVKLTCKEKIPGLFSLADDAQGETENAGDRPVFYKRIPEEIICRGGYACLLGAVTGLLEQPNVLSRRKNRQQPQFVVKLYTASSYLRDSVLRLFRKVGVRCGVTVSAPRDRAKEAYTLFPSLIDLAKILGHCRFVGEAAKKIVGEFLATFNAHDAVDNIDSIPVSREVLRSAISELKKLEDKSLYYTFNKAIKKERISRFSALKAIELLQEYGEGDAWFRFVAIARDTGVHWEAVESVTAAETQDVFDLEVPDTKVFVAASGLVIYDTMTYEVVADDAAAKEALHKMLPSRNLIAASDYKRPMHQPRQEYVGGLHKITSQAGNNPPVRFASQREMIQAWHRGEIDHHTNVEIQE